MVNNSVAVVISSKIALHTATPYINELKSRGTLIEYVCDSDTIEDLLNSKQADDTLILVNDLHSKHFVLRRLHQILLLLITPIDYSSNYYRWLNQRLRRSNPNLKALLLYLIKKFPKCKKKEINTTLTNIFSNFISDSIKSQKIIVFTVPTIPYILCDRSKKIYSILESWDHPGKAPIGYQSRKTFLWNRYLANDWEYYQGRGDIHLSYPVKLNYAIESEVFCKGEMLLYPAITSSDSEKELYEEEIRFMHILCRVTAKLGVNLLIKPKPNTRRGDLNQFLIYTNVTIGLYQQNNGGSSYTLNDEYNISRLEEMSQARFVLNVGTTFAFDASAVNIPVLQLKFTNVEEFPVLSNLDSSPHLSNHLFIKSDLICELTGTDTIEHQLIDKLRDPYLEEKAVRFKEYLRDWLIPAETMQISVSRSIDEITKDD